MKTLRIAAALPLTLISLMDVGYILPTDPKHDTGVAVAVLVLGVAGLVAAFGLARGTTWGIPAALTTAGVNAAAAVIALVGNAEGAAVGLVVSALALGLSFAAGAARPSARHT